MELRDLRRTVAQGESLTVEFKRKVAHPDKIERELVAIANTHGGELLIGVSDDGSMPGVKFPEDEIFVLEKAIKSLCRPALPYTIEQVPLNEKTTIVIFKIPKSDKRPHYVKESADARHGQTYVRHEDKSVQASREMREIIARQKKAKDIHFNFGEKEKILMSYLERHKQITLSEFRSIAKINKFKASKTLIILVLANIIAIQPTEKGDIYKAKNIS